LSDPETSEGDMLERCLDLLEEMVDDAMATEEVFNPAEYVISAEIVHKANQILADFEEV